MNNVLQAIPEPLQHDIQRLPQSLVINVLQDLVREYKRKEANEIIAEADAEMAAEGEDIRSAQQRRTDFVELRSHIISKYF